MAVNINVPDAWTSYVTQTNLGLEIIPFTLYDTLPLSAAAIASIPGSNANVAEMRFFQQTNVTADVSNQKNQGMLANPEALLIQSIRLFFKQPMTTNMTDAAAPLAQLLNQSVGLLRIGNKEYGPWPLWLLATANRLTGCNVGQSDCFYVQTDGPMYPLFPNLMLSPLQPFVFFIRTTPPQPSFGSGVSVSIQVVFDGQLARSIQ